MHDPLDDALGLPPMVREEAQIVVPEKQTDDTDYEFARENMYRLTGKIDQSIDELSNIAYVSQHPRAYEVLANLYKTAVDANKELLGLKKTKASIDGDLQKGDGGPKTINNNLIMSSEDVLAMIKGHKK